MVPALSPTKRWNDGLANGNYLQGPHSLSHLMRGSHTAQRHMSAAVAQHGANLQRGPFQRGSPEDRRGANLQIGRHVEWLPCRTDFLQTCPSLQGNNQLYRVAMANCVEAIAQ